MRVLFIFFAVYLIIVVVSKLAQFQKSCAFNHIVVVVAIGEVEWYDALGEIWLNGVTLTKVGFVVK